MLLMGERFPAGVFTFLDESLPDTSEKVAHAYPSPHYKSPTGRWVCGEPHPGAARTSVTRLCGLYSPEEGDSTQSWVLSL